ncbi:hypothetical protein DPMN_068304 [Dreissena polymorpha]|uniref:Uncharacterized protein n=1 Tax=Dreissena polymorpha TaxID=45954 RepID=A0A9D4BTI2_DREPO|nr:hypothetical protein DPMN_068304 [Dreissena polymorpha]
MPTTPLVWLCVKSVRPTSTSMLMRYGFFAHVIGAIDGKQIACKAPANTGYDYKGVISIILLAVVTSDYTFMCDRRKRQEVNL